MISVSRYPHRALSVAVLSILLYLAAPFAVYAQNSAAAGAAAPADDQQVQASQALFLQIATVLKHPRCSNCHTVGESLKIGDEQKQHKPRRVRGTCDKCHGYKNSPRAPGAADWRAPPADMGWDERAPAEICSNLKNPLRNGNRTPQDLAYHMTSSPSVLWAWHPGGKLSVPPIPHAEFKELFSRWVDGGAHCPGE